MKLRININWWWRWRWLGDCDDKIAIYHTIRSQFMLYMHKIMVATVALFCATTNPGAIDTVRFQYMQKQNWIRKQDSLEFSTSSMPFAHLYSDLFAIDTVRFTAFSAAVTIAASKQARLYKICLDSCRFRWNACGTKTLSLDDCVIFISVSRIWMKTAKTKQTIGNACHSLRLLNCGSIQTG